MVNRNKKESKLVQQVRARNSATRDAVGLGTEIVLDNMRHPKKLLDFASSTLGLAITGLNQRNLLWTNQRVSNVRLMSKKVDSKIAALKAKHGKNYKVSEALDKQLQLVNAGYKIAIDGDWGKESEKAWLDYLLKKNLTKLDATDDNILYSIGASKHPKVNVSDAVKGIIHTDNALTNAAYKYAISPAAEFISPRFGLPAIGYFRGVVDSNNPLYTLIGGANWEDSMFGPRTRERFETRIKNGLSTYVGTSREGSSAADDIDYALSNLVGGYTNHNGESATDTYDWKNYGTFDDATTKFKKNTKHGFKGFVSGVKNIMEWAAPYIMVAEKGESKATHLDTGLPVKSFTDDELAKINRPWLSAPKMELKVKK